LPDGANLVSLAREGKDGACGVSRLR
jgi:hypothetical protein